MKGKCLSVFFMVVSLFCLLSCGLDVFYYIDYIPDSNYTDISGSILLPSSGAAGYGSAEYFTHFIIFYRIYVSDRLHSGRVEIQDMGNINAMLYTDWSTFNNLTNKDSTTVNTSNLENSFYARRYYLLALETMDGDPVNINNVLSSGSLGRTLTIEFPTQNTEKPTLSLSGGDEYVLLRAMQGQGIDINPVPDNQDDQRRDHPYFQNDELLYNDAPISFPVPAGTNNADTYGRAQTSPPSRYTYVSMYIAAVGRQYLTTIYSQPTFIGIFKLPDRF